jgi:serine/threonine protein kinase
MVSSIVMPQLFPRTSSSSHALQQDMLDPRRDLHKFDPSRKRSSSVLRTLHKIGGWLRKDEVDPALPDEPSHHDIQKQASNDHLGSTQESRNYGSVQQETVLAPSGSQEDSLLGRTLSKSKKVVPELSRQFTTKRQNSEKRERLLAIEPSATERRAVSAERRPRAMSPGRCQSPLSATSPSRSAPDTSTPGHMRLPFAESHVESYFDTEALALENVQHDYPFKPPPSKNIPPMLEEAGEPEFLDDRDLQAELESRWILNLSMHFRDKSDREKFFVTYAQHPNRWCRVTISCDYRDAPPSSLESDLKSLKFQRDKNQRIYEAIRESLPDIDFYDTVTNLKLETEDGQLHVHVTEDINEIIPYPSVDFVEEGCRMYRESELDFQSHLSGFVYKVRVGNQVLIKKEIPGPDTIDEFLYEIEVLNELRGSKNVIDFHGLVVDDDEKIIKGLLISFASLGALVDVIYDDKLSSSLSWHRRERWAYQIIQGLSEIHEAGFVQGDFTLSNIVVNSEDDAKIIDINRRGCPIGWEPPELLRLVRRGQKISMFINVKSDIFQLGMVLWALAQQDDEPEHVTRTSSGAMPRITAEDVPNWFEDIVDACLSKQPQGRPSARELLTMFPLHPQEYEKRRVSPRSSDLSLTSHNSHKEFNDPTTAVDWNAVEEFKRDQRKPADFVPSYPTTDPYQFINAATSTEYRIDSTGSYVIPHRGRSPHGYRRRSAASSTTSLSLSQGPPACEYLCNEDITGFGHAEGSHNYPANTASERPSVPDVPPFQLSAFGLYQEPDSYDQQSSRRALKSHEGSPHPPRQHRVLFGPPVHQDSGFDDFMVENIEHGQLSTRLPHNLHPILTTTIEGLHDDHQEVSAVTQPSERMTSPSASQSQPTPITPFSHHAPSNRSEARARDLGSKSPNSAAPDQ